MTAVHKPVDARDDVPRRVSTNPATVDRVFHGSARTVGTTVLLITGSIGLFLALQSIPTLRRYGLNFFTETRWSPDLGVVGIASVLLGTLTIALVALAIAIPLATLTALFITEYAPPRARPLLISLVDLMAAVPSIVYGLWGFFLIQPHAAKLAYFLRANFAWVPFLHVRGPAHGAIWQESDYVSSAFIAGIAVSMMVLPMACAVMREVFAKAPAGEREAAYALGSTRWGMIRAVVLPFGKGGIIGGSMLALGRALGETIAVVLIISPDFTLKFRPLENGTISVSSLIAGRFGDSSPAQLSALLTAGFVLFLITLGIDTLAAVVVNRSRSGAGDGHLMTTLQSRPEVDARTLPAAEPQPLPDAPRPIRSATFDDRACLVGSAAGSLGLTWTAYEYLLPFSGLLGFFLCWFVAFVALYLATTALTNPVTVVTDRIASTVVVAGASLTGLGLVSAVAFPFVRGYHALFHLNFVTHDMSGVGPQDPFDRGGVLHAIVGTLIEIGIAVAIALPLGVGAAIYMCEVGGRLARVVRTVVEAMTALPSIVAGLFIYTTLIVDLGIPKTGFTAAMALSVMILPIIARASDVVLRVVPGGLREASLALGASRWQTVWRVVLPTVRPGLATALILGIARGIGETSPVLLTSGASTFFNANPLNQPMNSLPLFTYSAVRSGEPIYIERGFACACVLLVLVLTLFVAARLIARQRVR